MPRWLCVQIGRVPPSLMRMGPFTTSLSDASSAPVPMPTPFAEMSSCSHPNRRGSVWIRVRWSLVTGYLGRGGWTRLRILSSTRLLVQNTTHQPSRQHRTVFFP
jgi:hypothetical protein